MLYTTHKNGDDWGMVYYGFNHMNILYNMLNPGCFRKISEDIHRIDWFTLNFLEGKSQVLQINSIVLLAFNPCHGMLTHIIDS